MYNKITSIKPGALVGLSTSYMHLINIWNMKHTNHKTLHVRVYRQAQKSSCSCIQTQKSSRSCIQTHRYLHVLAYRHRNLHVLVNRQTEIFTFLYTDTDIFTFLYTDRHRNLHVILYRQTQKNIMPSNAPLRILAYSCFGLDYCVIHYGRLFISPVSAYGNPRVHLLVLVPISVTFQVNLRSPSLSHRNNTLIPDNEAGRVVDPCKGFVNARFILHEATWTPHVIIRQDGWE